MNSWADYILKIYLYISGYKEKPVDTAAILTFMRDMLEDAYVPTNETHVGVL